MSEEKKTPTAESGTIQDIKKNTPVAEPVSAEPKKSDHESGGWIKWNKDFMGGQGGIVPEYHVVFDGETPVKVVPDEKAPSRGEIQVTIARRFVEDKLCVWCAAPPKEEDVEEAPRETLQEA